MIGKASDKCGSSDFTIGTAEILPFRDNSFDAVSSLLSFSYLKHPEKTLVRDLSGTQARGFNRRLHSWKEPVHTRASGNIPHQRGDEP